jgi:hypothetical protein
MLLHMFGLLTKVDVSRAVCSCRQHVPKSVLRADCHIQPTRHVVRSVLPASDALCIASKL